MNFFKNPTLYRALAFVAIAIGLLLAFIASGFADTYYPDDGLQKLMTIAFVLIPALLLAWFFLWIAKRLKTSAQGGSDG